jgi:hypothetical protein
MSGCRTDEHGPPTREQCCPLGIGSIHKCQFSSTFNPHRLINGIRNLVERTHGRFAGRSVDTSETSCYEICRSILCKQLNFYLRKFAVSAGVVCLATHYSDKNLSASGGVLYLRKKDSLSTHSASASRLLPALILTPAGVVHEPLVRD